MLLSDTTESRASAHGPSPDSSLVIRIEALSQKSYAAWALFVIATIEGSVFPIPPDPLFFALCLGNPRKSFRFAAISASGSFAGSLIGYGIGFALFESFGRSLLSSIGVLDAFYSVLREYHNHGVLTLILSGFTPVPYSVVTIAAGFSQTLSFGTLLLGSLIGRAVRFGLLGGLFYAFGEAVKRFLQNHGVMLAAIVAAFIVLSVLFLRWLL